MDNLHLNYRIEGRGPPLLLVHGFGISFNIWRELVPFLRMHFSLILIELPGTGQSPMPEIDADYLRASVQAVESLRLALGFEKWDVLGYSTGSRIAEAYVQTYSASVGQVIFLCPLQVDIGKMLCLRLAFWMDSYLPSLANWFLRGARLRFLISLFGFNLHPDPHAGEWYDEISVVPPRVLKETVRTALPRGRKAFSVPTPYSLIWGDVDIVPVRPPKAGKRDHFVHASHAAPVVAAEEVARMVVDILEPPRHTKTN
jgi:pimeloyl-ACP methyl ester carboxylesterase